MTLLDLDRKHIWHPLTQEATDHLPIPIVKAEGLNLIDEDGRTYWDLISSWWINIHGHCHPHIVKAVQHQATQLEQVIFAGFTHAPAVTLASRLIDLMPEKLTKVFFADSGSTAVEIALKMAYQYWRNQDEPHRKKFVALTNSYHGDTFGAMSVGRSPAYQDPFDELLFDVELIPFPATWIGDDDVEAKEAKTLEAFEQLLETHGDTLAAFIFEPLLQGQIGMHMCRPGVVKRLVEMAQSRGILVIFDEILVGFGRLGTMFAHQQIRVVPDLICLSKGLTSGFLPLSVTIASQDIYDKFYSTDRSKMFTHSQSFTGNPISCAAACASLEVFSFENTLAKLPAITEVHQSRLSELARKPYVARTRCLGTVAAWDLVTSQQGYYSSITQELKVKFLERGMLIRPIGMAVYIFPPYCITPAQLNHSYDVIEDVLDEMFVRRT